jgi:hypothetical protein
MVEEEAMAGKWYRYRKRKTQTRVISIPEGSHGPEKCCF